MLASATEAELRALLINGQKKVVCIRKMLEEMGYPQPATPMETDNPEEK